nr:cache domain-containing protein [Butyrivibrio sp.]
MAKKEKKRIAKSNISFKDSIKTRLIAIMLAIAIVPLLISILISYKTSTDKAMEDAQISMEWQAQYIESRFVEIINRNMDLIRQVGINPTIIAYIGHPEAGIGDDVIMMTLTSVDQVLADGNGTTIAGADGMQIMRSDGGKLVDVHEREYFQQAMKGQPFVSDVIVSASTGLRQITMAAPIYGDDRSSVIGIVTRNYDLNDFHKFLAEESEDAFITDRTGLVAAHSQYEIGNGAHDEDSRANSEFMTSGKSTGFYHVDTGKGYQAFVAYVVEPQTNYRVCVASNSIKVLGSARQTAYVIITIGIIMGIIAAIISFMMGKAFVEPIIDVSGSLSSLADGRFEKV